MPLIECIPNVSEGRDAQKLARLSAAVASVDGAHLLHRDSGLGANRTVFTFAGKPEPVAEAAFRLIAATTEVIDMREHAGVHPRIGATDVCPFVPLRDASMGQCIEMARALGERVGRELDLPVYLYGEAASAPERAALTTLRRGQYEALPDRLRQLPPDYGPTEFRPRFGAVAIGARELLIAFNVDLQTRSVEIAQEIARLVRSSGGRDGEGKHRPGLLPSVLAIGWWIEEYGHAQVSMNLQRPRLSGLLEAFRAVQQLAEARGVDVIGSEVIGMLPQWAIDAAARDLAVTGDENVRRLQVAHALRWQKDDGAAQVLDLALRSRGLLPPDEMLRDVP